MIILEVTFILIIFINFILNLHSQPTFCETTQFDGAYNFGPHLVIRKGDWIWFYDYENARMFEKPEKQSHVTTIESLRLLTSFYINEVPNCTNSEYDTDACDNYAKALYMSPILLYDINSKEQFANVYRLAPNGSVLRAEKPGFPWFMDVLNYDIWPPQWRNDGTSDGDGRASAYWSERHEVLFISGNGKIDSSMILHNKITEYNWWLSLREQKLLTRMHFIGLIHFRGNTYALADNRHDSDIETKLYNVLLTSDNHYNIQENNFGLKMFFGCDPLMNGISPKPDEETGKDTDEEKNKKPNSSSLLIVLVIIIIVLVFIIALIGVIVFVVIRKIKKSQYTVNTSNDDNSNTVSGSSDISNTHTSDSTTV